MAELEHGGRALGKIHRKNNDKKLFCHFTGFLEGIAASRYLEAKEVEPLIAECLEFLRRAGDADAYDIIEDFKADLLEHDLIDDLALMRADCIDPRCTKSSINRFLGFCRGIVCDGIITVDEAKNLVQKIENDPTLLETTGIRSILVCATDALADGILDAMESEMICEAIGRVVGDCYGDTGIAQTGGTANYDEHRLSNFEEDFLDRVVVLTGTFSVSPRSILENSLREFGAVVARNVTSKTDFVIVGGEASRDWIELNRGTKIIKAEKLREASGTPNFVSEAQVLRHLSA